MDLQIHNKPLPSISKDWNLFLDRDGVINIEKENDYIRNAGEFNFCFEAPQAIAMMGILFDKLFVVTNQRGVAKGLMNEEDLLGIHAYMMREIVVHSGRIDKVYYCTDMNSDSPNRKPNPGMGLQAKHDFPSVDFNKSLMVGNATSDMAFGKNLGMFTVFIPSGKPMLPMPNNVIDAIYPDLISLAKALQKQALAQ